MIPPLFVLDTQALVRYLKGLRRRLGSEAFKIMIHPRARIVVPSYALEEIQAKFARLVSQSGREISIPPTACLRLLLRCSNTRVFPRGATVLAEEFRLGGRTPRKSPLERQDIPVAATVLAIRRGYAGTVSLVTCDQKLRIWASCERIPVVWE